MTIQKFICIPGTLLEIVAGRTTIGILNALYLSLAIFCLIILSQLIFIFLVWHRTILPIFRQLQHWMEGFKTTNNHQALMLHHGLIGFIESFNCLGSMRPWVLCMVFRSSMWKYVTWKTDGANINLIWFDLIWFDLIWFEWFSNNNYWGLTTLFHNFLSNIPRSVLGRNIIDLTKILSHLHFELFQLLSHLERKVENMQFNFCLFPSPKEKPWQSPCQALFAWCREGHHPGQEILIGFIDILFGGGERSDMDA